MDNLRTGMLLYGVDIVLQVNANYRSTLTFFGLNLTIQRCFIDAGMILDFSHHVWNFVFFQFLTYQVYNGLWIRL